MIDKDSMNFVASWRPGADKFYTKADAQKVAEEILSLGDHPETDEILEMARDENTEIHKIIEWNDGVAAEKYRLVQIRNIQHDLQIVEIGLNKKQPPKKLDVPVRMFFNLHGETGYRPTPVIIQDEDLHKKLLRTARLELEAFMKKYNVLSELQPLIDEIEKKIIELKIFDEVS